jgi:Gpi18-like mannosyltransferase
MMQKTIQMERYENHIILTIGIVLAVALRFSLREFESGDFRNFLEPWYDFINQQSGFGALKYGFSNYTPAYLYLMVIVAYLFSGLSKVFAVKLIALVFDFVCAFFVCKIVRLKYPLGVVPVFAFLATLFAPTVFLNSAFW